MFAFTPGCCCEPGEFTPTCAPDEIEGCVPQALEDTELTFTIPDHTGVNPECATIGGDYVLTWNGTGWSYTAVDFFASGYDLRIGGGFTCVDGECFVFVSILVPAEPGLPQYAGTSWFSLVPFDGTLPMEVPVATLEDAPFPCDSLTIADSAFLIGVTGF